MSATANRDGLVFYDEIALIQEGGMDPDGFNQVTVVGSLPSLSVKELTGVPVAESD